MSKHSFAKAQPAGFRLPGFTVRHCQQTLLRTVYAISTISYLHSGSSSAKGSYSYGFDASVLMHGMKVRATSHLS